MRRLLAAIGVLVALVVGAATILVRNLDRPFVKRRIQKLARDAAGVEVDYAATRVRLFEGLRIEGLVVRQPAAFASVAPELLRVGTFEIGWAARTLVGIGSGPRFSSIKLFGLQLTVVRAVDGRTSFGELGAPTSGAPPQEPAASPTPPSRILAALFDAMKSPIGRAAIDQATLTAILLDATGAPAQRFVLDGVALSAATADAPHGWRATAELGTTTAPLALALRRELSGAPLGDASLRLSATVTASAEGADARVDLAVERQTIAPALRIARVLGLEAHARADRKSGRLVVDVRRAQLADDAALVDAELELPDDPAAQARVPRAHADIDLVRLLALLPDGLVPVHARRARAKARLERVILALPPRLERDGVAMIDAELAGVDADLGGKRELSLASARIHATGRPAPDGATSLDARLPLGEVTLTLGAGRRIAAGNLTVGVGGRVDKSGTAAGDLTVGADAVDLVGLTGGDALALRAIRLGIALASLRIDAARPLATRGRISVNGEIGSVALGRRVQGEGVALSLSTRLTGSAPYAVDADVSVAHLRLSGRDGRLLVDDRAHLVVALSQLFPDAIRTRAVAHATVDLGALHATVDAAKRPDAVEWDLTAAATDLKAARTIAPLITPAGWQIPWDRIGLGVRSKGSLTRLAAPTIAHTTELRLDRPTVGGMALAPSAKSLTVGLSSRGSLHAQEGEADVRVVELTAGGTRRGDGRLAIRFALDPAAATARVAVTGEGEAAPTGTLSASLAFDRARRALSVATDGELAHLTLLAPIFAAKKGLRGLDLSRLALGSRTHLTITGVVEEVTRAGAIRFAKSPLATLGIDGTVSLHATNVRWAEGDREVRSPRFGWRGELHTAGERRTLTGALELAGLRIALGEHLVALDGVRDATELEVVGDLRDPELSLSQVLSLTAMRQDLVPSYPVGDLALELRARRHRDGIIRLENVSIDNDAAGTSLALSGGLDFSGERTSLSLRGTASQDLAKAWSARQLFVGRGVVKAVVRVDSANLSLFHALASLTAQSARVELPRARMLFDGVDGEIPPEGGRLESNQQPLASACRADRRSTR